MNDPKSHAKGLKGWFLRRGYPQWIVREQMDRTFSLPLKHDTQQNKNESGIPLVVTYNPTLGIYLWHCGRALMKNFKKLQNAVPKDVRFALMFQKHILLNSFRQKNNIRLIITLIVMVNVWSIDSVVRFVGYSM